MARVAWGCVMIVVPLVLVSVVFTWLAAQIIALKGQVNMLKSQVNALSAVPPPRFRANAGTSIQDRTRGAAPGMLIPEWMALESPPNFVTPMDLTLKIERHIYGGKGDAAHLGGFTADDREGQSPAVWTWMMKYLYVKSVIDVGCGRGISTKWFQQHGARVLCVEGSHDALNQSYLDKKYIVQHDYSKGPWWPEETYDAAWAVEFVEHVGRQYMQNYLPTFRRSALIFKTHSYWGGWHHVEVHPDYWWRVRMEAQGFVYSRELSTFARRLVQVSTKTHSGAHLTRVQVFINPEVASLPQHAHLMGVDGCYGEIQCNHRHTCPCEGEDALPPRFESAYKGKSPYDDEIGKLELSISDALRESD